MAANSNHGNPTPRKNRGIRQFSERYRSSTFAYVVETLEPLGVLLAGIGLLATGGALLLAWDESVAEHRARELERNARAAEREARREERQTRRAALLGLAYERLEAARRKDEKNPKAYQKVAHSGQIPVLERMAALGLDFAGIDASDVNLVVAGSRTSAPIGINLDGANFTHANLGNANLAGANLRRSVFENATLQDVRLRRANLLDVSFVRAKLQGADLSCADLTGGNFEEAKLQGTNVTQANLSGIKNLTQNQLDQTCGEIDYPPVNVPKPLSWKGTACKFQELPPYGEALDPKTKWPIAWGGRPCPALADLIGFGKVVDGDTIILQEKRIRLQGLDAPELTQNCWENGESWACGARAAKELNKRISGRSIRCSEESIDRYGRVVGVCLVDDTDLGAWMVVEGWALAYRRFSKDYVEEEAIAAKQKKGIWRGQFDPPWDWRRGQRRGPTSRAVR